MLFVVVVVGFLLCAGTESESASYWVSKAGLDANNGSQGAPFLTIQAALNAAVCGDTITVLPGVYTQRLTFVRNCTSSTRLTLQGTLGPGGAFDTIIDGSTSAPTWTTAPEIGPGVFKATLGAPQFLMATFDGHPRYVWKIADSAMDGTVPAGAQGNGNFYLARAASATTTVAVAPCTFSGTCTINAWDGLEALWGTKASGVTYLRFRDEANPGTRSVRVAAAGGVLRLPSRSFHTIKNFQIRGGEIGVELTGSTSGVILEQNHIRAAKWRIALWQGLTIGALNANILRNNILWSDPIGFADFTPGDRNGKTYARAINRWTVDTDRTIIGNGTPTDTGIFLGAGAQNTTIQTNTIDYGLVGIRTDNVDINTTITGNTCRFQSETCVLVGGDLSKNLRITTNLFVDNYQHVRVATAGLAHSIYAWANRSQSPWYDSAGGSSLHYRVDSVPAEGSLMNFWLYHNSIAGGGWGIDLANTVAGTLRCSHVLNNVFSANGLDSSGGTAALGELNQNLTTTTWFNNTLPSFLLPVGLRNNATDLIPRGLPGMNTAFYADGDPDEGALQGSGGGAGGGTQVLTLQKSGAGSGTVTSSPAGLNCGATCAADFTTASTVTLTAVAGLASTFAGWSGACSGTGPCVVTMSTAQVVTATFAVVETPAPPPSLVLQGPRPPTPFAVGSLFASATVVNRASSLTTGLLSWWRVLPALAGGLTWYDLQGQAHLVAVGMSTPPWRGTLRPGGEGEVQFLGEPDTYLTTGARYAGSGPFTVMAWVRPFTTGSRLDLLGQVNSGFTQGWGLFKSGDDKLQCAINGSGTAVVSLAALAQNAWVHVACTFDGSTLRLYLDGVAQGSLGGMATFPAGLPLTVGALPGASVQGWYGAVDDIVLFDRVLPQPVIAAWRVAQEYGAPGLLRRAPLPLIQVEPPAPPGPITVEWSYDAIVGEVFQIERCTVPCGAMTLMATRPIAERSWTDTTADVAQHYCYRLAVTLGVQVGPYSNTMCSAPPGAVGALRLAPEATSHLLVP